MFTFPILTEPSVPININAQIVGQLRLLIALGELQPGDALPTVVELAKHLGVNHNTVATVYNELIESGYLVAQRGKGTFVAQNQAVEKIRSYQHIYNLLAQAYNIATQFGLSSSEFAIAAYAMAVLSNQQQATPLKLVFVAEKPQWEDIYSAIRAEISANISFLDISDLKANLPEVLEELKAADLVITTAQYLWLVTKLAAEQQEIFIVDVKPDLELLVKLSSLPRHARLLLVGKDRAESEAIEEMLKRAGIHHLNLQILSPEELEQNLRIWEQVDRVIVSRSVLDYVEKLSPQSDKILVLNFSLEPTNISVLKARLAAIQSARQTKPSSTLRSYVK